MILTDGTKKINIPDLTIDLDEDDNHEDSIVAHSELYLSQLELQNTKVWKQWYSLIAIPDTIYHKLIASKQKIPYEQLLSAH